MGGRNLENHIGEKYGCLTITGVDRERMKGNIFSTSYVFADCDCGVKGKSYNLKKLRDGETRSCGHLRHQHGRQFKKNTIIHRDGYGVILTKDNTEFYFDVEDEHYLIGKYWYKDSYGYLTHCYVKNNHNNYIRFHRLIMGAKKGEYIDHISTDKRDNRKSNLRFCSHRENDINKKVSSKNTSGIIGVGWDKSRNKWRASITVNRQSIFLGRFENLNDAIFARLKAEMNYFGTFAPQRCLFDKYGVN